MLVARLSLQQAIARLLAAPLAVAGPGPRAGV